MVSARTICAPLLLLAACGGPNEETLLDELRVLAMVPEAPELGAAESTVLHTRVVDPLGEGYQALVWPCTSLGDGCLEDQQGRTLSLAEPVDGQLETPVSVPVELAAVASEEPTPLVAVWALACAEGLCPLIEAVGAGEAVDPALLASPLDWLGDLPMQGVSLAFTTLMVSARPAEERHPAPALDASLDLDSLGPSETLTLQASATGALGEEARIWMYAEAGGFVGTDARPDADGAATLSWVAPEEAGEVALYLVLVDGLGGSALWEGTVTVAE